MDTSKVLRLIIHAEELVRRLKAQQDFRIHRVIDQFYYMEKAEELKILLDQRDEAANRVEQLTKLIHQDYKIIYCSWVKDSRRLNRMTRCRGDSLTDEQMKVN